MKNNFIKATDKINKMFNDDVEIEITVVGDTILTEVNKPFDEICKLNFLEYDFLKSIYVKKSLELKKEFPLLDFSFAFSDFDKNISYMAILNGDILFDAFDRKNVE